MNWFVTKFRGYRYAMNRKMVEMRLSQLELLDRAEAVVVGLETVQRFRSDDTLTGILLERAVTGWGSRADIAAQFYDTLEDSLNLGQKMLKQSRPNAPAEVAKMVREEFERQELGIRLLLVALGRIVDRDFKKTTREVGKLLFDARPELDNAMMLLAQRNRITSSISPSSWSPDYDSLKVSSDLFLLEATLW